MTGAIALLPGTSERRLHAGAPGPGGSHHLVNARGQRPGAGGQRGARRDRLIGRNGPGVLGGVAWWAFDISVLWAMFHAFGPRPRVTVIWMLTSSA